MLDEFEDVSKTEKAFMKIWNTFIKSSLIIPDYAVPSQCLEFIHKYAVVLIRANLRQKLLLHLFNLWDSLLISSHQISICMAEFDSIASTNLLRKLSAAAR